MYRTHVQILYTITCRQHVELQASFVIHSSIDDETQHTHIILFRENYKLKRLAPIDLSIQIGITKTI